MDRPLIYPMEVPNSSDLLYGWQRTMVALSKLAQATLGTGTWVTDFSATPGAGLSVTLGPAQAFVMGPVDATAYGSIPADSNQILKQYLLDGYQTISLTAPTTSGDAINYLLQLTPVDEDTGDVVLQYFDPANPDVAFGGPNNNGTAQATERLNTLQVQLISGATAPAGSQPTPTLTGIVGVVITVTAGQTSIVTSNIVYAAGSAPYVPQKLPDTAVTNLNNFFTASQNMTGDLSVSGTASIANGVAGDIAGKSTGYQSTGLTVAWNYTDGQGEVDLLLGPQGGAGGLNIYALNSAGDFTSGTPIFALTSTGTLSLNGTLTAQAGTSGDQAVNYTQLVNGSLSPTFGTASAAAGTSGNELVNFNQFGSIYSTGNQSQVQTSNTTASTSVSFTAPCNGWCFLVGSRNVSSPASFANVCALSFNGTTILQDNTVTSATHMGTAYVTAGEGCTATYTGASPGPFSLNIGMIFVPDTNTSI